MAGDSNAQVSSAERAVAARAADVDQAILSFGFARFDQKYQRRRSRPRLSM
jgi:hypothetical protein